MMRAIRASSSARERGSRFGATGLFDGAFAARCVATFATGFAFDGRGAFVFVGAFVGAFVGVRGIGGGR